MTVALAIIMPPLTVLLAFTRITFCPGGGCRTERVRTVTFAEPLRLTVGGLNDAVKPFTGVIHIVTRPENVFTLETTIVVVTVLPQFCRTKKDGLADMV